MESAQNAAPGAGTSGGSRPAKLVDHEELRDLFKNASDTTDMNPDVWIPRLRDKILTMLKTPLKQEFNAEVYSCIFQLCLFKKRFAWLCSNETRGWTRVEAKHFSFIARLSLNELHILLPHLKQHLIGGDQAEMEDGKVMCRPASVEEYHQFDVHLMILEDTIQSLVHDQDNDDEDSNVMKTLPTTQNSKLADCIEPAELKSLLERMKEVLVEIFDYLELVHKGWAQLVVEPASPQFCASLGALRIASAWISEDVGSFQAQCESFFIDLIIKYLLARRHLPDTMPDLLIMALDAICLGDADQGDNMKKKLKSIPSHRDALQNYLDFIQEEKQRTVRDQDIGDASRRSKRRRKEFKFRCSLISDLLKDP